MEERNNANHEEDCMSGKLAKTTISLGEPYESYCYKLIAAVMEKPR